MRNIAIILPLVVALSLFLNGCSTTREPHMGFAETESNQPQVADIPVPSAPKVHSPELLLFGGRGPDVFLGCLNCSKFSSGSVWNKFGDYGSKYNEKCIWNKYGPYGSKYEDECPWNRYGQKPPVIVDREGNFYGYFTANPYFDKRTTLKDMLQIIDAYETIMENFDAFVDSLK